MAATPRKESEELIKHQFELERVFSKNQLMPRLRSEFDTPEVLEFLETNSLPSKFGIDLLAQMALRKRADLPTLIGLLRHHYNGDAQDTADALLHAAEIDLIDWSPELRIFIVRVTVSEDVHEELDRFQYPLPMVVEPAKVSNNLERGYLLNKGSILLRDNHHDGDVCLDHINHMNSYCFKINNQVASMVKNSWRNLESPKEGESQQDYERRLRAFDKYDRTTKDVMEFLTKQGNEFYLTHRYDKRGRTYCQGYHVNYQAASYNKAVIQFAEGEVIEE